ncbi:hypothetical protein DH86_00002161, partial [Scytalidium sp. 3C]
RNKVPRPLTDQERARLDEFIDSIHYSARYSDDEYEYRHVQLPKNMLKIIPKEYHDPSKGTLKLLWEEEWRGLGITQIMVLLSCGFDLVLGFSGKTLHWVAYGFDDLTSYISHTPDSISFQLLLYILGLTMLQFL